jgi:hypothetical protein
MVEVISAFGLCVACANARLLKLLLATRLAKAPNINSRRFMSFVSSFAALTQFAAMLIRSDVK